MSTYKEKEKRKLIEHVLYSTNIVDVLAPMDPGELTPGRYKCKCIFDGSHTMEFNSSSQRYYCDECWEGGDLISAFKHVSNLASCREAAERLAVIAAIDTVERLKKD